MTRSARSAPSPTSWRATPRRWSRAGPRGRSNEARAAGHPWIGGGARRLLVAPPPALHDRARVRCGADRRTQGRRIAADQPRALSGALADRALVGELSPRRDVERLVGRAARADAEPRADRGIGPAPAAERGHRRERCGD